MPAFSGRLTCSMCVEISHRSAAPGSIAASDGELNSIIVVWDSVPSGGFYKLFRADTETGTKTELTGWITDTSHSDAPSLTRQDYYYWVKAAVDATGTRESSFCGPDTGYSRPTDSNAPEVTVSCLPVAPIETQEVQVDVSATDNDMLGDVVLHWEIPGVNTQTWASVDTDAFDTAHSIGSFTVGVEVVYWAECWDHAGNRAESAHHSIVVEAENVSVPSTPAGPSVVYISEPDMFSAFGSSTSLEGPVEYQVDWQDGQTSLWGTVDVAHSWSTEGYRSLRARARSQARPVNLSDWSGARLVHVRDWNKDYDGDTLTDAQEAVAGTDPSDGDSSLRIAEGMHAVSSTELVLVWPSVSNRFYHIEVCNDLQTGFGGYSVSNIDATPPENTFTATVDTVSSFFRIGVTTNRLGE